MTISDDERKREEEMQAKVGPVYDLVIEFDEPSGATLPFTTRPLHRDLLKTARRLTENGEHQAAVILAQTANEVQVERAIAALLRHHGITDDKHAAIVAFFRNYNLAPDNKALRHLWEALSGDTSLTSQPFWGDPIKEHVKRRNLVAHQGHEVSEHEADASIRTVLALMEHMEGIVAKLVPPKKVKKADIDSAVDDVARRATFRSPRGD